MSALAVWVLAAALWAGCLVPGPWWTAAVGVAVLGAAGSRCAWAPPGLRLALAVAAMGLIGAGLTGGRIALVAGGALPALAGTGEVVTARAVVVTDARPAGRGAWVLVRVDELAGVRVRERAVVRLDATDDAPPLGTTVAVRGQVQALRHEGVDAHLRRLHAGARLEAARLDVVAPPQRLLRVTGEVRDRAREAFDAGLEDDRARLLAGIVLGDRSRADPHRAAQLAGASLTHLVVVSGRHVAVLLAALLAVAAVLRVGLRLRTGVCLVALAWFAILVRWQPSVLRATAMATLVLLAVALGRGRDGRHVLGIAVVVLLLIDPLLAGQAGFGLSVGATAGVLVGAPWLAARLAGPRWLRLPVAVTVGAQAGAAPLLLRFSDGIPVLSVPANLLAVPAAGLAQLVGLAAGVVAQVDHAAGAAMSRLAGPPLAAVLWSAAHFSDGPLLRPAHLLTPGAVVVTAALLAGRRRPLVATAVIGGVVALAWLPATPRGHEAVTVLTVTQLDVGQGDAVLVEVPAADPRRPHRLLVDGGPEANAARDELVRLGVGQLDVVVLSHPHHDHSGGLPLVLARLGAEVLLVGPISDDPERVAASVRMTTATAEAHGVAVHHARAGQRFDLGDARVEVLSPPPDGSLDHDPNEASLVLRLTTGDGTVLLTGDAEELAQRHLLRRPDLLRADVLKVPHHGGATNARGFLAAVGAEIAVIGVGAGNDYGHPHDATLRELDGTRVLRTDVDGAVRVHLDGSAGVLRVCTQATGRATCEEHRRGSERTGQGLPRDGRRDARGRPRRARPAAPHRPGRRRDGAAMGGDDDLRPGRTAASRDDRERGPPPCLRTMRRGHRHERAARR